jgi:hypothetical protein
MLRTLVIAAGVALICVGIALLACGVHAPGWQAIIFGALVLIGTLFERWRYRHIERPAGGPWQPTGERFIDPSSGEPVEVMFDPTSGERRYVDGARSDEPRPP